MAGLNANKRQRLIESDPTDALAHFRALIPSRRLLSVTSGLALPLGSTSLHISSAINYTVSKQQSRFFLDGRVPTGAGGDFSGAGPVRGVIDIARTLSFRGGITASGAVKRIDWSAELAGFSITSRSYSRVSEQSIVPLSQASEVGALPLAYAPLATRTNVDDIGVSLTAASPLFPVPAGDVTANLRIASGIQRLATFGGAKGAGLRERFTATRSRLHAGLYIPLVGASVAAADRLGALALIINGDLERSSGADGRPGYDATLNWQATRAVSISFGRSNTKTTVDLTRSLDPVIYSSGTLVVDGANGNYAVVTGISGGTPGIRGPSQTDTNARVGYNGAFGRASVSAAIEYATMKISDPIISTSDSSVLFQRHFPDRFTRDRAGTLTAFDMRAFNAVAEEREILRSSLHFAGHTRKVDGSPGADLRPDGVDWDIGISHEWAMRHSLRPSQESTTVNLLKTPLDGAHSTPRHNLSLAASARNRGRFPGRASSLWVVAVIHTADDSGRIRPC